MKTTFVDCPYAVRPDRPDWALYGAISFPYKGAKPSIRLKHIDGPLLTFSDGQLHWLTLWECLLVGIRWHDAASLQRKLRPRLQAFLDKQLTLGGKESYDSSCSNPRPSSAGSNQGIGAQNHGRSHKESSAT